MNAIDPELRIILEEILTATEDDDSCDGTYILTSVQAIHKLRNYLDKNKKVIK